MKSTGIKIDVIGLTPWVGFLFCWILGNIKIHLRAFVYFLLILFSWTLLLLSQTERLPGERRVGSRYIWWNSMDYKFYWLTSLLKIVLYECKYEYTVEWDEKFYIFIICYLEQVPLTLWVSIPKSVKKNSVKNTEKWCDACKPPALAVAGQIRASPILPLASSPLLSSHSVLFSAFSPTLPQNYMCILLSFRKWGEYFLGIGTAFFSFVTPRP